jgi:hypothetical protein
MESSGAWFLINVREAMAQAGRNSNITIYSSQGVFRAKQNGFLGNSRGWTAARLCILFTL